MAYAALVSVWQTLEQILDSDSYFFPCNKEKVESFQETIASLIAFLDNCPPICTQTVDNLITQIRDLAYEAEDVFESLVATHFLKMNGSDSYENFKVFPQGLENVMEDFESIEKEVSKIHLDGKGAQGRRILSGASSSRPASRGNDTKMVALDNDLELQLMEQLVGAQSKIDVIPIVGMGGIGKTTLARILYNSQLIKETFEIRGWVTISQTYNVDEIVLCIINDIGIPLDGEEDGGQHLYHILYDRKYLIVLDDVWNTQAWDDIKRLFPDNNNGSRIIITTRHSDVAAYANSFCPYHKMQLLNEDLSWSLLCQEIFPRQSCPSELVDIGREIASQCQGLPLAISAIGGHLKKEKQTEEYWKYVSENVSSVLKTANDPSLEILTLSYNYLPHRLKACFLYFGSFPEDHAIDVSEIVKLWVAEGFVKPSRSHNVEEVAKRYLYEIIDRNLVFVDEYDSLAQSKRCVIHDLFRDICIREAKKEKFLYILRKDVPFDLMEINSQRRLILSQNTIQHGECGCSSIVLIDSSCSATRSFSCSSPHASSTTKLAAGLLKVLNIRMKPSKFPVEFLELVNLKYLELGLVLGIPPSISRLRNLQTLVAKALSTKSLPAEIWEISRLRHLLIWGFLLPDIPKVQSKEANTYVLKNLQTLSDIFNFRCTEEALARIPNLKTLSVYYTMSFHSLNNFVHLCELESLRCLFSFEPIDNILPNFTFPFSLKKLVLVGGRIPWEQITIIGKLPNLEVLKLKDEAVAGYLWETNDGEFKKLKVLRIGYSDLVEWKTEKEHFPSLECLKLEFCSALKAIPSEIGEIPTLETIVLIRCSLAANSSAKEMLEEDSEIELIIYNDD